MSGLKRLWAKIARTEVDTLVGTLDYGALRVASGTMGYKHRETDLGQVKRVLEQPFLAQQHRAAERFSPC